MGRLAVSVNPVTGSTRTLMDTNQPCVIAIVDFIVDFIVDLCVAEYHFGPDCQTDYVEIFDVQPEGGNAPAAWRGRYCGVVSWSTLLPPPFRHSASSTFLFCRFDVHEELNRSHFDFSFSSSFSLSLRSFLYYLSWPFFSLTYRKRHFILLNIHSRIRNWKTVSRVTFAQRIFKQYFSICSDGPCHFTFPANRRD